MTKEYILNFLSANKNEFKEKYGLKKIGLFGSYAKDTANKNSDIDIVIETEKKDFFIREDMREYLEKSFKVPVDIGYLSSFREYYKKNIEKDIIYV